MASAWGDSWGGAWAETWAAGAELVGGGNISPFIAFPESKRRPPRTPRKGVRKFWAVEPDAPAPPVRKQQPAPAPAPRPVPAVVVHDAPGERLPIGLPAAVVVVSASTAVIGEHLAIRYPPADVSVSVLVEAAGPIRVNIMEELREHERRRARIELEDYLLLGIGGPPHAHTH